MSINLVYEQKRNYWVAHERVGIPKVAERIRMYPSGYERNLMQYAQKRELPSR